ncbi:hypothetical protein K2Z83_13855 [Oscillochloris sp. ZM17-4]|uniref:hypothetical protein n=1 Tax=Oscillochloris sp. ZM17-4 TaxID=2866714 RepID=UPI001C73B0B8|nr:hypothetical protein [Oscillochloris sp. ZM17-4]MBX0328759.1 hypothetical protein [Oscillochloris sp. ZM17-4]
MSILLGPVIIFFIILVLLLGVSVGVAFLLHWLLPAVGLDMALLVALIAVVQSALILGRLMSILPPPGGEEFDEPEPPIVILDREIAMPRRRRKRP